MLQSSVVAPIHPLSVLLQPIRRGGQAMCTLMITALLHCYPNPRSKTARKKSATKRHCSSFIAQTSASKKKRSQSLSSINKDDKYLDSDDDSSASSLL